MFFMDVNPQVKKLNFHFDVMIKERMVAERKGW